MYFLLIIFFCKAKCHLRAPSSPPSTPQPPQTLSARDIPLPLGSNSLSGSISIAQFSATSSEKSLSGTKDGCGDALGMMASIENEINADRVAIQGDLDSILKKCDDNHANTQETRSRSFDKAHEVGGDGDAPMGSE